MGMMAVSCKQRAIVVFFLAGTLIVGVNIYIYNYIHTTVCVCEYVNTLYTTY